MSSLFKFGVNEFPNETGHSPEFDVSSIQSEVDFDIWYRNYAIDMKVNSTYDPSVMKKVGSLCDTYTPEQLNSAIKDMEWSEVSAKRNCYAALADFRSSVAEPGSGGVPRDLERKLTEAKDRLESVLVKLTVLRLAVDRLEDKATPQGNAKEVVI